MKVSNFIEGDFLRTKLRFWRSVSIFIFVLLLILFFNKNENNLGFKSMNNYIARIYVNGLIIEDEQRINTIRKIYNDNKIKAVIVHINSPGGSVVGSEQLYNELRKLSNKKTVVAVMDSLAASGGYMVALAADYIIAHAGTITGSIGVVKQSFEITELQKKLE